MIQFFGMRGLLAIINEYLTENNHFVRRWRNRMTTAAKKSSATAASKTDDKGDATWTPGSGSTSKVLVPGRYGDVEWLCYEAWVAAFTRPESLGGPDIEAMIEAVKEALVDQMKKDKNKKNGF